ncbi:alpha/beta hydrolase, partial [Yersinia pestis]
MTSVLNDIGFKSTLLAAVISLSSGGAMSADYKLNPFTLTYDGDY